MIVKTLYRIKREGGGVTVTLSKPEGEYTTLVRIIAEEGKAVTKDGVSTFSVIDAESSDGWYEVDAPVITEEKENEN